MLWLIRPPFLPVTSPSQQLYLHFISTSLVDFVNIRCTAMPAVERMIYRHQAAAPSSPMRGVKQAPTVRKAPKLTTDVPTDLSFEDPNVFLSFISSLSSPTQLLTVKTFHIQFDTPFEPRSYPHHNSLFTGLSVLLRHLHNLRELTLNWDNCPSSVLNGTSFRLQVFESWMRVDNGTIAFLDAQRDIRVLELKEWGSHLAPLHPYTRSAGSSSRATRRLTTAPIPPNLAPHALPNLIEFSGHAEVAAQLVPGRPVQVVNFTEGFEPGTTGEEWREMLRGLEGSTAWIGTLSIATLETFSLDMLAAIGQHCQALEFLYLRVVRQPYTQVCILSLLCAGISY